MSRPFAAPSLPHLRRPLLAALLVAVALAGGLTAHTYLQARDPAWRLVQQGLRQTHLAPAGYLQIVERQMGPRVEREVFQVWQDGTRRKAIQLEPVTRAGFTTERRGLTTWTYAPQVNLVLKSFTPGPPEAPRPKRPIWRVWHTRRASLEGRTAFEGRPVRVIALISQGRVRQRFWILTDPPFVVKQERYDPAGHVMDTTVNRSVTSSPASIRQALTQGKPKGPVTSDRAEWFRQYLVTVLAQEAPFRFLAPGRLPDGFRLKDGRVFDSGEDKVVALRFTAGNRPVSLFQRPAGSPTLEPPLPLHGLPRGLTVYRRTKDGVSLLLISPLRPKEAETLFSALVPTDPRTASPTPSAR